MFCSKFWFSGTSDYISCLPVRQSIGYANLAERRAQVASQLGLR